MVAGEGRVLKTSKGRKISFLLFYTYWLPSLVSGPEETQRGSRSQLLLTPGQRLC